MTPRLDTTITAYAGLLVVTGVLDKSRAEKIVDSVFSLNLVIAGQEPTSLLTVPAVETTNRAIDLLTDYFGVSRDTIGVHKGTVYIGYRGRIRRDSVLIKGE